LRESARVRVNQNKKPNIKYKNGRTKWKISPTKNREFKRGAAPLRNPFLPSPLRERVRVRVKR
jgi:hypothetical protein